MNPLQPGHLTPYVDHTKPTIRDVLFRNQTGALQTPLGLCGRVELDVDAFDTPPVAVPGKFQRPAGRAGARALDDHAA